jgi:predicted GNAT family acetyltransferase
VTPSISDKPTLSRYEIAVDGAVVGFVTYKRSPGQIAFIHTETEPGHKGEGLGSRLVRSVLDTARADGLAVLPFCPFVRGFIQRHREYAELVPAGRRAEFGLAEPT